MPKNKNKESSEENGVEESPRKEQHVPKPNSKQPSLKSSPSMKQAQDNIVIRELKALYDTHLLPIERKYLFSKFHAPEILPAELSAKPQVLLLGQYSVGKTTFIKHLIGKEYSGMHIGPEPTTDKFIAVVHGEDGTIIKGNSLTGVSDLPFGGLSTFGGGFLNKFEAACVSSDRLKAITFIDTPGVLSGEKQRITRGYDFAKVSRWFAERSDLILLVFDAFKLDISDEFRCVIEELRHHEDKVRCVLNKADGLDTEALIRVYGALLWSMGKIFKGSEVTRVLVGSFSGDSLSIKPELERLFKKDSEILMRDMNDLPKACSMRKVNEIIKRIRLAMVHVCIMGRLRAELPYLWGLDRTQKRLITRLPEIFQSVQLDYNLSEGDFPSIEEFRATLRLHDFRQFPPTDRRALTQLKDLLTNDIPRIMKLVGGVQSADNQTEEDDEEEYNQKNDILAQIRIPSQARINVSEQLIPAIIVTVLVLILAIIIAVNYEEISNIILTLIQQMQKKDTVNLNGGEKSEL
eukprot:CAMPEP_0182417850 /NCGR_PEP_ID=MMETSP1167-20130531/2289_1 /TAXON_ID=2988 /ORGANISM="Mallomonas Sp, Strain CCMP3275" /LENGTH=519 /DNA_ID=CAMNT_0024591659 /DNA_START=46 /DNA_END=1605 /DNA_ORIENTATION=-